MMYISRMLWGNTRDNYKTKLRVIIRNWERPQPSDNARGRSTNPWSNLLVAVASKNGKQSMKSKLLSFITELCSVSYIAKQLVILFIEKLRDKEFLPNSAFLPLLKSCMLCAYCKNWRVLLTKDLIFDGCLLSGKFVNRLINTRQNKFQHTVVSTARIWKDSDNWPTNRREASSETSSR